MKKFLKITGVLLGLVFLLVISVVVFISTRDPNDYKQLITDTFQEKTGRPLSIEGDIRLSIYPWLGVELNGVTVGNAPGFGDQAFLQTEHAMVRAKLGPLLRGQYIVDTVRLHGVSINLAKNSEGISNWDDLAGPSGEEARSSGSDAGALSLAAIVLGGVDIRDAGLTWDDQSTNTRHVISNLVVSTGELVYGEPIDVALTMNTQSNQPELSSDVSLESTIIYNLDDDIYEISPFLFRTTLRGPNIPEGSTDITLSSTVHMDLDEETLTVDGIDFNALETRLTGTIRVEDIQDPDPTIETDINLSGNDMALLFKVAEIEPIASTLASLSDRSFNLATSIKVDLDDEELEIPELQANILGASVSAQLEARDIKSTDEIVLRGTVNAEGQDLPVLLQLAGQLQGGTESGLSQLATQVRNSANRSFKFNVEFDADMDDGDIAVTGLQANLLGADITGEFQAEEVNSSEPEIRGSLNASGPNLPSLMQLAGQLQGGQDSALSTYGRQLNRLSSKNFVVDTRFDVDMDDGDVIVPSLSIDALGVSINGNLSASDIQSNNGDVNGQLAINSDSMGELLAALDQAELGEVLQSMDLNAAVNGSGNDLNITPMNLKLVFSGDQIQGSPVQMTVSATSRLNLEQDTLSLNNFQVAGLGLNLNGQVSVQNMSDSAAYTGEIEVTPFNLKSLMRQLNQNPPEMADETVLEQVSLSSAFDGSTQHMNISRLKLLLDDSTLEGTLSVSDFESPAIDVAVNIDQINIDRYLPPPSETEQATPVTPETAAGAAAQLPLETLRSLNARGQLNIGELVFSNAKLSDVVLAMNAKDGDIYLSPVSANLYQGAYRGDVRLDATSDQPVLSFDSSLTAVEIEPLLMDSRGASNLSGTGNINLSVTAQGIDSTSMFSTMNGNGQIALENGVLRGIDVARVLAQVEIMLESKRALQIDRGESTPFETFNSTIDIKNGVVSSNDLQISAPGIQITGRGKVIDLNNNTLDYSLAATADPASATVAEERYNIGGYTIPIRCSGNTANPSCVPDLEEIIKIALQREVQRKIGNVLQKALGVEQPAQQPEQPLDEQSVQEETPPEQQPQQQAPQDPAQQILNKALEGIFKR
jgi:uncharacterized protein involved in outer membrane biogenesis